MFFISDSCNFTHFLSRSQDSPNGIDIVIQRFQNPTRFRGIQRLGGGSTLSLTGRIDELCRGRITIPSLNENFPFTYYDHNCRVVIHTDTEFFKLRKRPLNTCT